MSTINYEETINTVREFFVDLPKHYLHLQEELKRLDEESQDILHLIEMVDLDLYRSWQASKELRENRRNRRKIKDELNTLDSLKEVYYRKNISKDSLDTAVGKLREVRNSQETRGYRMRQRTEWQSMVDKRKCMSL